MPGKIQVACNLCREMCYRVGDRDVKARMKFAIGPKAAGYGRCFEHQDALAALRQISSAHQSVMSSTDND